MYVVVAWCITLQGRGIHSGWSGMRGNKSGYACGTDDSSQQFPQPPYVTKHATFPNMELGTSSNGIATIPQVTKSIFLLISKNKYIPSIHMT